MWPDVAGFLTFNAALLGRHSERSYRFYMMFTWHYIVEKCARFVVKVHPWVARCEIPPLTNNVYRISYAFRSPLKVNGIIS